MKAFEAFVCFIALSVNVYGIFGSPEISYEDCMKELNISKDVLGSEFEKFQRFCSFGCTMQEIGQIVDGKLKVSTEMYQLIQRSFKVEDPDNVEAVVNKCVEEANSCVAEDSDTRICDITSYFIDCVYGATKL